MIKENKPYLIVGNGKLAKHIIYYFNLLEIPHYHWFRGSDSSFTELSKLSKRIVVLISDNSIKKFILENYNQNDSKIWIHCSGAIYTELAYGAHPLNTFSDDLYSIETYKAIPFIVDDNSKEFLDIFPELPNPYQKIKSNNKALYHAWCSIAGNFTTILWSEFFTKLENIGIPKSAAYLFLNQTAKNLINIKNPLTGPLLRRDENVIKEHISSLEGEEIKNIYEAFVESFPNLEIGKKGK